MNEEERQREITILRIRYEQLTHQYVSVYKEMQAVREQLEELGVEP
jgi:hypothetical protein